ncbi:MAG TPA: alpha/beta fold hydrolase [Thermoanaerobaculia bacterium]|nr:alpha/beta fold hydrolase [Thermoanaerobaculia bacterium]
MSRRSGTSAPHGNDAGDWTGQISSSDGTAIHYDVYHNESRSVGLPLILIIPGFWRHRRYPTMPRLARFIQSLGYSVAILDVRGHGQSGGSFGFNLKEHEDVEAVGKELLARLQASSIILFGFSLGGAIAVSTAARTSLPIRALLLISPVADLSLVSPRVNPFSLHRHVALSQIFSRPRFSWRFRRSEKIRALDDIARVAQPLTLIHVKNDWLVGHQHSIALFEAAVEPKELVILDLPGNLHADRIFSDAASSIEPLVCEFLARNGSAKSV